jgi:phenylpropionate dioxygenase-like ring-hydroxylating dioxygenase large terminal subunit
MIRNQWYVVLESKEVPRGKLVGVTRMGEKLVFWRDSQGKVVCLADRCPHLGASLCMGKHLGDRIACPFHGFEYDPNGQCRFIPALGRNGEPPKAMRVAEYPTHEAHRLIWIWWGEPRENLPAPRWFDIDESFSYSSYKETWPVHYSRMIENQMDVMHLPHVHFNTIGRGGRMVVDGPIVTLEDDIIRMWVYNRKDDGTLPRKPEELPPPSRPPFLEFIFPNIWQNRISEDMRIFVAFVPVDEEHGMFYLRQYQRVVRIPPFRQLFNWMGLLGSRYIASQDKRVVSTQLPKKSSLRSGEKFIQGDRIILTYRRRREELITLNNPFGRVD